MISVQQVWFEEALNTIIFLDWPKKFGLAQNILGPVKGQGINHLLFTRMLAVTILKETDDSRILQKSE